MFDFDGDGDINAFGEEMTEYELQLMEDEIFLEGEEKKRYKNSTQQKNPGKSCGQFLLVAVGFFITIVVVTVGS